MKYRVAELEGELLDAAVALAEGLILHGRWWRKPESPDTDWCGQAYFDPSQRWQVGGPIIERERIATYELNGKWCACFRIRTDYGPNIEGDHEQNGRTLLIAAMRAYVASKLGEEVELP